MSLTAHAETALASIASFGTTVSVASVLPPDLGVPASLLPYVISVVGPALVLIANRVLASKAAGKRARAAFQEEESKRLAADADPTNDAKSAELRAAAAENRAEADALDALKPGGKQ